MANVFDLTVSTPQEIVITNKAKTEEVFDAGSLQRSNLYRVPVTKVKNEDGKKIVETTYEIKKRSELSDDELATAKKVAFKNTTRRIQMYKTNNYVDLEQGDSVKITAEYSEEVAYFISLASEDLKVVAGEVTYPLTKE